jgi:hypothetical protein
MRHYSLLVCIWCYARICSIDFEKLCSEGLDLITEMTAQGKPLYLIRLHLLYMGKRVRSAGTSHASE